MTMYRLPEELDKVTPNQASATKLVVANELEALEIVINDVDKKLKDGFFISPTKVSSYQELKRHGFSKTVVIDTELKGRLSYRISQATSDYANTKLGFSTPNTLIGNLCRAAKLGMTNESKEWGEYTIVEVRNFARYSGKEAADQIKNFRVMESQSLIQKEHEQSFQSIVTNLRTVLDRWFLRSKLLPKDTEFPVTVSLSVENVASEQAAGDSAELDFDINAPAQILADIDAETENGYDIFGRSEEEENEYYGLSNYFFLNPTEEQLTVMTNTVYAGPMLVEGVAGSGKTCVALGRAKTLIDLALSSDDIQYNNDFLVDSCVGFVRTGELVQYLKASCHELDIPRLPIEEYAKLVYELSYVRNLLIEQQKKSSIASNDVEDDEKIDDISELEFNKTQTKYQSLGAVPAYDFHHETTMSWLHAICSIIGARIADDLRHQLEVISISEKIASDKFISKAGNVVAFLNLVKSKLTELYQPILSQLKEQTSAPFALDQIIHQIDQAQTRLEQELFDKQTKWVNPTAGEWHQIKNAQNAVNLLRQYGSAFVVYERVQNKSIMVAVKVESKDDFLNLFRQGASIFSEEKPWLVNELDEAWQKLNAGDQSFSCQFQDDQPVPIKYAKDFDDINIDLINNKLFARINKRVFQISEVNPFCRQITSGQKLTSLEKSFKSQLRRIYRKWQFADLYRDALLQLQSTNKNNAKTVIDGFINSQYAIDRLKNWQLADHDKDLLLALAHIMTRGVGQEANVPSHLLEQSYYRSVFIDEVQDFTEQQIFLMAEQASPKYHSVTLVGDMHQQLHRGNVEDLDACFPYHPLNKYLLKENKRQERQPQLAATSMLFRAMVQNDNRLHELELMDKWQEQAQQGNSKQFYDVKLAEVDVHLLDALKDQPHGRRVAVICPTLDLAATLENRIRDQLISNSSRSSHVADRIDLAKKHVVHFSCPDHIKGLEFDTIIYAGMEHIDWNDSLQVNKAYVTISRPRKQLLMFGHAADLPQDVHACLVTHADNGGC